MLDDTRGGCWRVLANAKPDVHLNTAPHLLREQQTCSRAENGSRHVKRQKQQQTKFKMLPKSQILGLNTETFHNKT